MNVSKFEIIFQLYLEIKNVCFDGFMENNINWNFYYVCCELLLSRDY